MADLHGKVRSRSDRPTPPPTAPAATPAASASSVMTLSHFNMHALQPRKRELRRDGKLAGNLCSAIPADQQSVGTGNRRRAGAAWLRSRKHSRRIQGEII